MPVLLQMADQGLKFLGVAVHLEFSFLLNWIRWLTVMPNQMMQLAAPLMKGGTADGVLLLVLSVWLSSEQCLRERPFWRRAVLLGFWNFRWPSCPRSTLSWGSKGRKHILVKVYVPDYTQLKYISYIKYNFSHTQYLLCPKEYHRKNPKILPSDKLPRK